MWDNAGKIIGAMALMGFTIFMGCILTALAGYCAAWVVSWVFQDAFDHVFVGLGIHPTFTLPQFGAFVGFVSGFLKTRVTMDSKTAIAFGKVIRMEEEKKK